MRSIQKKVEFQGREGGQENRGFWGEEVESMSGEVDAKIFQEDLESLAL